jgi:hypothetical protein
MHKIDTRLVVVVQGRIFCQGPNLWTSIYKPAKLERRRQLAPGGDTTTRGFLVCQLAYMHHVGRLGSNISTGPGCLGFGCPSSLRSRPSSYLSSPSTASTNLTVAR